MNRLPQECNLSAITFTAVGELTSIHPLWEGSSVINIRLSLSDGTDVLVQMGKAYCKVLAKELLKRCEY